MRSTWERRIRQLASPQRDTGAPLRSERHSAAPPIQNIEREAIHSLLRNGEIAAEKRERRATAPSPEHIRLCEVGHGYGCVHYQQPRFCFSRELVYAKSSTSRRS
jgi:hypothetical protein